jgi:polysaccharide pyruvyl transferase WcaK-like protein
VRVVTIGDVGVLDDMIHIGDEAMFEEFVRQIRQRGATAVTGVSSNPEDTAERYGIDAVPTIGFAPGPLGGRPGQVERMRRVLAAAAGDRAQLADDDRAWQVIEAIRHADAVAVSGGGNMASNWSLHIFERAIIAALADAFGRPLVVSGQTIGPELTSDDRVLVGELLRSAALVGVRERASFALVEGLGIHADRLQATIDDASFLGQDEASAADPADPARPFCAVSLSTHVGAADRDAYVSGVARLLDAVVDETGLEIVFHAHFACLDATLERGDTVIHGDVARRMRRASPRVEPTTTSQDSARLAKSAALVISSRYHPAVFAVAAGVPTVGIAVDGYTTVKLTGALGNLGQSGVVSAAQVVDGTAIDPALGVWRDGDEIRSRHAATVAKTRAASDAWWDRVWGALRG